MRNFMLIKEFLQGLISGKYNGEVSIRITFNQGGIRALKFFKETEV
jgi:hypothetical protein